MSLEIMPDIEATVSGWLQSRPELTGVKIATEWPPNAPTKVVLLHRSGGETLDSSPMVADKATLQLDVYAQSKGDASDLTRMVAAVLAADFVGEVEPGVWVTSTTIGNMLYLADPDVPLAGGKPRPRYALSISTIVRPMPGAPE